MDYKRVLVFGDIHACYIKFRALVNQVRPNLKEDFIIFLGDYIDRGENPIATLDYIMKLKANSPNVVCLRGNHEWMADLYFSNLKGRKEPVKYKATWLYNQNGGNWTLRQMEEYEEEHPGYIEKVRNFISGLPYTYEMDIQGQRYFFVHAGVEPMRSLDEQVEQELVWNREEFYDAIEPGQFGGRIFVVGHTPVQYLARSIGMNTGMGKKPLPLQYRENVILMDTGSYIPGGLISCRDFISGDLWQA